MNEKYRRKIYADRLGIDDVKNIPFDEWDAVTA